VVSNAGLGPAKTPKVACGIAGVIEPDPLIACCPCASGLGPIRGISVKRSLHVVSTIGGSASFFVLFLAIGRVATMFEHHTLPLGEWGGVVIALVVTVALCFVATAAATWGAGALPRLRLLCCIAIGGAAWFSLMGLLSPR
jgi:hypothetical protein